MDKKLLFYFAIPLLVLFLFWQLGGVDYILSRTIFVPDYSEGTIDSEVNNKEQENGCSGLPGEETKLSALDLEYEVEVMAEGLEIPWEIAFLPDGRLLVTERPGRVVLLDEGSIATIHDVEHIGEGGLLGLQVDPNFEENSYIYIYYTYRDGFKVLNRVSRFIFTGNALEDEEVILDELPGDRFHNGGRIGFGPDGMLYVTTGDASQAMLAQDLESLAGKILRVNSDGSIPTDNPFPNSPVFSFGHRNAQGLAWHPGTGQLYSSEHGPTRQDEINLILSGENYGWPLVTCEDGHSGYQDPIVCYLEFTLAPSGMAFLHLEEIEGISIYVAGLRGNMLMRIDFDNDGRFLNQEPLFRDWGRLRTAVYHDGSIYVATNNRDGRGRPAENDDRILKVTPVLP